MNRLSNMWAGTGLTSIGLVRSTNQDAFAIDNAIGLWIVADGMGGHAGGQIASETAVSVMSGMITSNLRGLVKYRYRTASQRAKLLSKAVAAAGAAIYEKAAKDPRLTGMGTTVVAAFYCAAPFPSAVIAHLGDSRAYMVRQHTMLALTRDHSLVQDLVKTGQLTDAEAKFHPKQHVLSNALGLSPDSIPDIAVHRLEPDSRLLLCTDGLTKMVTEEEITGILMTNDRSDTECCRRLIDCANTYGGNDNTTVLLIAPVKTHEHLVS
jgi:protein phosphatase